MLSAGDLQFLLDQLERLARAPRRGGGVAGDGELERLRGLVRQARLAQGYDEDDEPEGDDGECAADDGWDDDVSDDDEDDEGHDGEDDEQLGGWSPWRRAGRFAPTAPIKVEGGLTAKSRRGAIGETWWSKRFLEAVEPLMVGGRSSRGRSYARQGQVLELEIGPGKVTAQVQGSRRAPYKVQLVLPPVTDGQWETILAALAGQAGYGARLLAGEIPHELEQVFAAAGVPLLPSPSARVATDCTCPDWANPCKHVGAVCYLLAEELDRDPFQLLAWRGRGRSELLGRLAELRAGPGDDEPAAGAAPPVVASAPPLSSCVAGFWKAGPELAEVRIRPQATELPSAVLRQCPRGLVEVAGSDLADVLEPAYSDLVARAERRAVAGS